MTSSTEKVAEVLRQAKEPLTVNEICKAAWKRVGVREANAVRVALHRLRDRGLVEKIEARYSIKGVG